MLEVRCCAHLIILSVYWHLLGGAGIGDGGDAGSEVCGVTTTRGITNGAHERGGGGASWGAGVNVKWKGQPPGSDDVDDSGNPLLSSQPPLPPCGFIICERGRDRYDRHVRSFVRSSVYGSPLIEVRFPGC